jgi:hypothetical protein
MASDISAQPKATDVTSAQQTDPLVQYVVLRRDLWSERKWALGPVAAQACHASCAAIWMHREDEATKRYVLDIDSMHKGEREESLLSLPSF